jgi:hypothetical protein
VITIDSHDFKKARFLREARNQVRPPTVEVATGHYERELEAYTQRFAEALAAKKAQNEATFENTVRWLITASSSN